MNRTGLMLFVSILLCCASCARFSIVSTKDPLTPDERLRLASVYEAKGELEAALSEYEKAASADKKNAVAHFAMGNIHLKMKNFRKAGESYLRAVEAEPRNALFRNNLGWAYMENRNFDKARRECAEALRLDPARGHIYLDTLGVINTRSGDFVEAEKNLSEALKLAPPDEKDGLREIYGHLLELYEKTGEGEKAAFARKTLEGLFGKGPI